MTASPKAQPDRARLLLSFRDETAHLTRREIMDTAGVAVPNEFQSLLDAKLIAQDEWRLKHANRYRLTPLGIDRRDMYREIYSIING